MSCEDFIPFIDAFVDQEFDEREHAEMDFHLSQCTSCRERVAFEIAMKRGVKSCLTEKAPSFLKDRIFDQIEAHHIEGQRISDDLEQDVEAVAFPQAALAAVDGTQVSQPKPAAHSGTKGHDRLVRFAKIATPLAAAIAAVVMLPSFTVAPAKSGQLPVIEQAVDWHVGNYPIEVTGPEATRVSEWFRNKVDFPVRLPQFSGRSANLLGARIAHVQDRRAAYLLYEVDGVRMSMLVFDGDGLTIPSDKIRQLEGRDVALLNSKGYEVAVLQDAGVTYTLTSELAEPSFVDLVSASLKR